MANRNWASGGRLYSPFVSPVLIDCNFVVDSTNGNGLGSQIILQARSYTGAEASPVDGSVISLAFLLNNSGVQVQGE